MEFVPKKLYYKIREVCEIVGVEAHVLRFWETEFSSLAPPKSKSGQRTYRPKDIDLILRIRKLLYEEGYTIAGARKQLSSRGATAASASRPVDVLSTTSAKPNSSQVPEAMDRIHESESAESNFEDLLASVADKIDIGAEKRSDAQSGPLREPAKILDVKETPILAPKEADPEKPASERLKRVQAELENILTLLDRE